MSEEFPHDPIKQDVWQAFWNGYKMGKDVEDVPEVTRRTALARFERWWRRER